MRSLAYGTFSDLQVSKEVRGPAPKLGTRYELLDRKFNVVDELDTIMSAGVEHSVDRDHMGSLGLTMGSLSALRDMTMRYLIRPWIQLRMPGEKWVEYPLGAYIWVDPERQLPSVGIEEWNVTLADQCWRLSVAGPGLGGFRVNKGQRVTDVIRDIYQRLGYSDLSGIAESDEVMGETKFWIYQTPNTPAYGERKDVQSTLDSTWRTIMDSELEHDVRLTAMQEHGVAKARMAQLDVIAPATTETFVNWGQILSELQLGIGYEKPYFDLTGTRPIARPARNLATEGADHHYVTDLSSIIESASITPDFSSIGNRVTAKASNADGYYGMRVADANDLFPNHPLAQRQITDYIDIPIEDSTASSGGALQLRANKELGERLARHRNVAVNLGLNPAHEPFDLVGLTWTDDPDLETETLFKQSTVSFDLDNYSMTLDLGLVVQ